jgi:hypothetical protein
MPGRNNVVNLMGSHLVNERRNGSNDEIVYDDRRARILVHMHKMYENIERCAHDRD